MRNRFGRFTLIAILGIGAALSSCASTPPLPGKVQLRPDAPLKLKAAPLRLFIVGDTGSKTQQQKQVAELLAREAEKIKTATPKIPINAVVFVGDNFYERGVKDVNDPMWRDAFENVYDARRLPMPFFAVLGNHDWVQNPMAEIEYSRKHKTRWQMDNFWYRREYALAGDTRPLADLFFIDSDLWLLKDPKAQTLGKQQSAWLEAQLKNSKARWKLVFAHHPLYSDGSHGHEADIQTMRGKLSTLLAKYRVDAYICGHDHDLQRAQVPQVKTLFLVTGAGGKLRPRAWNDYKPFFASTPGFLSLQISPKKLSGAFIGEGGKVLDAFSRAPQNP